MANELQYQKHLTDAVKEVGGYAFKTSNRFMVGVPDLFVQLPWAPHSLLIEVKVWRSLPKKDERIANGLTPLQQIFLITLLKAGTKAGWLAVHRIGTTDHIFTSSDPNLNPTRAQIEEGFVERKRGQSWTTILHPSLDPLWQTTP